MLWAAVSPISQYIVRRVRPSRWLLHWLLVRCAQTPTCTRCQVSVVHEAPRGLVVSIVTSRAGVHRRRGRGAENAETTDPYLPVIGGCRRGRTPARPSR